MCNPVTSRPIDAAAAPGPWLSLWLIHPRLGPFTGVHRLPSGLVTDGGGRWRTVVRSTRKRVQAQVFRGFKSHLHGH